MKTKSIQCHRRVIFQKENNKLRMNKHHLPIYNNNQRTNTFIHPHLIKGKRNTKITKRSCKKKKTHLYVKINLRDLKLEYYKSFL